MSSAETLSHILVFKTNILLDQDIEKVESLLNNDQRIIKWNIDLSDIDHVLRIKSDQLTPQHVCDLLHQIGFSCDELPD